jgi:hypothetical protein
MDPVAVCPDPAVAAVLVGRGARVVLCRAEGTEVAATVVSLRQDRARPGPGGAVEADGRVSALVGDPADPPVMAAALEMARELYGGEPIVVATLSDARQFAAPSGSVDSYPLQSPSTPSN